VATHLPSLFANSSIEKDPMRLKLLLLNLALAIWELGTLQSTGTTVMVKGENQLNEVNPGYGNKG
jgi:hypothetical protein